MMQGVAQGESHTTTSTSQITKSPWGYLFRNMNMKLRTRQEKQHGVQNEPEPVKSQIPVEAERCKANLENVDLHIWRSSS